MVVSFGKIKSEAGFLKFVKTLFDHFKRFFPLASRQDIYPPEHLTPRAIFPSKFGLPFGNLAPHLKFGTVT